MNAQHSHYSDIRYDGLRDGCPLCAVYAADPFRMNAEQLLILALRTDARQPARSEAERQAMTTLCSLIEQMRMLRQAGFEFEWRPARRNELSL